MAVDKQAFITDLEQYGTVDFCDVNNPQSWVVVMSNWTSDVSTFESIATMYLSQDYPNQADLTLVNGVLKSQYEIN